MPTLHPAVVANIQAMQDDLADMLDNPQDYDLMAQATEAGEKVRLKSAAPTSARYVLVWMTDLPQGGSWRSPRSRARPIHPDPDVQERGPLARAVPVLMM